MVLVAGNANGQNSGYSNVVMVNCENKISSTRIDTTYGMLAYCVSDIKSAIGVRIDSVDVWIAEVPCPDNFYGCGLLHCGNVDVIKSCNYYILDIMKNGRELLFPIDEKYILKFIP